MHPSSAKPLIPRTSCRGHPGRSTDPAAAPASQAPVKTRQDASAGYHQVLAAHQAAWTTGKKTDPKILGVAQRQIRNQAREPEDRFGDGRQALEELRDKAAAQAQETSRDAARARALQRLAAEGAGLTTITPAATARQMGRTA
ncbi:hypothetical protein ACFRCI_38080 [Streptomyces sp. NPDC056638]|uniref:hypothetical protein n=1 Tax=Streptomyces sp. NPDC056638 TaxID=3345887 RepID=UPI0036A14F33